APQLFDDAYRPPPDDGAAGGSGGAAAIASPPPKDMTTKRTRLRTGPSCMRPPRAPAGSRRPGAPGPTAQRCDDALHHAAVCPPAQDGTGILRSRSSMNRRLVGAGEVHRLQASDVPLGDLPGFVPSTGHNQAVEGC